MKKYIFPVLFSIFLFSLPFIFVAMAGTAPEGPPKVEIDILKVMDRVVNWVFAFFLIFAVLMIIIAAFQFLTAGGDSDKIGKARDKLLYAGIGIAIAILSRAIIPLIKMILGIS